MQRQGSGYASGDQGESARQWSIEICRPDDTALTVAARRVRLRQTERGALGAILPRGESA